MNAARRARPGRMPPVFMAANPVSATVRLAMAGLAAAVLAAAGWSGPLRAQEQAPSAFSATYGDWTVRCAAGGAADAESTRQCAMEQRFLWRDDQTGQTRQLLTVSLAPADKGMEAVAVTPFGLLFEPGLRLRADDQEGEALAFQTCLPEGCIARGVLTPDTVWSFRAGTVLHVEAEPAAGGEPFRLEGSLNGFSTAHMRLLEEIGGD